MKALLLILGLPALAAASPQDFDLEAWKAGRGAHKPLKAWQAENPSPWRSYFNADSRECAERWYVNLGPLGLCTRMHDRSWAVFPACREIFPALLTDEHGPVWSAFEVVQVKDGSPADGKLHPGDLILGMQGRPLLPAQHVDPEVPMDNRTQRGLELQAGRLIDEAEGAGAITLAVLRPPKGEARPQSGLREWRPVESVELEPGRVEPLSIPLGKADLCRLRPEGKGRVKTGGLFLRGDDGTVVPVVIASKRGAGNLIGDPLEIPTGDWTLTGEVTTNRKLELVVETLVTPPLPDELLAGLEEVTLELDAIGSFGRRFDPEGEKARHYAAMLAHRLAVQQEEDGSWAAGGYASHAFHTSACGLALLSTGDPEYAGAVRRAAYYVADHGEHDKWSYSNGLWLVFLSEYYLATGDEGILPALRLNVRNMRRFVLSDYTAGHSFMQPGYGGSGWIGGGGVIALGLAVASHTPAVDPDDLVLLDRMLARAQELAPHGRIPYGRAGKVTSHEAEPGQGGSCATGPYFLASRIRGGAPLFTRNAIARYSTPPFGSAENGHATQTLHFVWGCLAAAHVSDANHRAHMEAYGWKFTTLREFDGFINKNNYRTEYHNGDGVIGEPYWRTAGYLLVMNAHRRNLAITGRPEYRAEVREVPVVYHRDRASYQQVMRNWSLVEAALGERKVPAFHATLEQLRRLDPGPELGPELRRVLEAGAPKAAAELVNVEGGPVAGARLARLVLGHAFEASFEPDLDGAIDPSLSKPEANKARKQLTQRIQRGEIETMPHQLMIRPVSLVATDADASGAPVELKKALFPVEDLTLEVADPERRHLKRPLRQPIGPDGPAALEATLDFPLASTHRLQVRFRYRSCGLTIEETVPLDVPAPTARNYVPFLTSLPVEGTVVDDYSGSYSVRIALDTGAVIGCEQRNDPVPYLLEGGRYRFHIGANTGAWGHDLKAVEMLDPGFRVARPTRIGGVGRGKDLLDLDPETGIDLVDRREFLCELDRPTEVASVYLNYGGGQYKLGHRVEAEVDGKWVTVRHGATVGLMPVVPTTARRFRVVFDEGVKGSLTELRLITPVPASSRVAGFSW